MREAEIKEEPVDVPSIIKDFESMNKIVETLPVPRLQLAKTVEEKGEKRKLVEEMKKLMTILKKQIENLEKS